MRLPIKLEGIIFFKNDENLKYLLVKRIDARGGFWQPITGGLEEGESIKNAVVREVKEETSFINISKIIKLDYFFQFKDEDLWLTEYVFGIEIPDFKDPDISWEHDDYKWCTYEEAQKLLVWQENKKALKLLNDILSNK